MQTVNIKILRSLFFSCCIIIAIAIYKFTFTARLFFYCKRVASKHYYRHLRFIISFFILASISANIHAQTIIAGKVTDKNNTPVENASIIIKDSGNGVTSDSIGNFYLSTNLKGAQTLIISSVGLKVLEQPIVLNDSSINLDIVLQPQAKELDPVIVSAGSFEASDKAKGASLTPIDAVTVAGNGGDISNALRSLPGAQQIGDQEGLFVRGGLNEETKQFIDGALLPVPNYSSVPGIIQPARVSPFLFKGILFNTGGYSALYGEALSSVLILESVDLPEQSSASLHIFPTAQGIGFQNLSHSNKTSYGINANYGNYTLYNKIIKQKYDFFYAPEYLQTDANLRIKTGRNGMLKFYTNYSYSYTGFRSPDVDSAGLKSSFENKGSDVYNNLSYRQLLKCRWKIDAALAYNYYQHNIINQLLNTNDEVLKIGYYPFSQKSNTINRASNLAQARFVLTKFFNHEQALRFGAEHFYTNDRYDYNEKIRNFTDNLTAAFAEGDVQIAKNIAVKIGMRAERSTLLAKINIAPRVSFAYRLNDGGQFNVAYGVFYQKPDIIYLPENKNPDYSQATHYVINYQKKINNRLLRIEAYYKKYKDLVTTVPDTTNSGSGYAKGVELFFRDKRTFKNFDYWITYTYLDTKRKFLNYPYELAPNFATPHTASIAVKRYFPDLNFNANLFYSIATGRRYYDIATSADNKTSSIRSQGKTNTYNQMNLSFAYLFTMFKNWNNKVFSGIGFGISNLFGTKQIFGYNYSYNGLYKSPITLPATRSYYIGLFMTFGVDRRDDFINEKL